jgi:hypothetical protein
MTIQATLKHTSHDGKITQHRKENHFTSEYAVLVHETREAYTREGCTMRSPIIARIYHTANTAYACIWVHNEPIHISGGGKAGGYGYHKASAALQGALDDAGVQLSESINGRGEQAMRDALTATARALGLSGFHIHYSHA